METSCPICGNWTHNGWSKFPEIKPQDQQTCIVAAGPDKHAQILAVRWCQSDEEFYWYYPDLGIDPYPTEATTHWMPWPGDPECPEDYNPPQQVIEEWSKQCECCSRCCDHPCGGVQAGGMCDHDNCTCDDDYYHDDYYDDCGY